MRQLTLLNETLMVTKGFGSGEENVEHYTLRVLSHCWWECKLVQPSWRTVWRFLKKLEIELPYDPTIPLLGIHTEETKIERDSCTPMFIASLFTKALDLR